MPANLQECHARRLPDSPPPLSPRSVFSPPTHDRPFVPAPTVPSRFPFTISLSRSYIVQKPFHGLTEFKNLIVPAPVPSRLFCSCCSCLLACSARVFLPSCLFACFGPSRKLLLNHIIDKLKSLTVTRSRQVQKFHPQFHPQISSRLEEAKNRSCLSIISLTARRV